MSSTAKLTAEQIENLAKGNQRVSAGAWVMAGCRHLFQRKAVHTT